MWNIALSTIASGVGCPYFIIRCFSIDPALTPILIGIPLLFASSTTSFTFPSSPIFPGFILTLSIPFSIAVNANL